MLGSFTESYMPLGDLLIDFIGDVPVTAYQRCLDLNSAVATVRCGEEKQQHTRTIFCSAADQVMVVHLEAESPEGLSFSISLTSQLQNQVRVTRQGNLEMSGVCPSHVEPNYVLDTDKAVVYDPLKKFSGLKFTVLAGIQLLSGELTQTPDRLIVKGARCATILLAAATNFAGFNVFPAESPIDPEDVCKEILFAAGNKHFTDLLARHVQDYQALFSRVSLDLGSSPNANLPTDERLARVSRGEPDPQMISLLFQFGRYLLITCSRPGTQPANLQGIWNDQLRPPWSSNYTININTEMNYWLAETCNLAECHEPLFRMIKDLSYRGMVTAKGHYNCQGWVSHHNTDLWRPTNPVAGDPVWSFWAMSGAWMCQHIWEHYLFTRDMLFLHRNWLILCDSARFILDWLVEEPNGKLTTIPSTSPENKFLTPVEKKPCPVTKGSGMDLAICWEMLNIAAQATEILGFEPEFVLRCRDAAARLEPYQIGSKGQLLEWDREFEEVEPQHRHISHLFGLYPGRQITAEGTPELFQAVRRSLELRGDSGTGWSMAWKVACWARLRDGDHALKIMDNFLQLVNPDDPTDYHKGGIYRNLFCAHPPFQIDGNLGVTAAIAEMLLQSHAGEIHLLPALPTTWRDGSVQGLRARGVVEVEIQWREGRLYRAILRTNQEGTHRVRYGEKRVMVDLKPGVSCVLDGELYDGNISGG